MPAPNVSSTGTHDRVQLFLAGLTGSARPGSCQMECEILAGKLFVDTGGVNGGVRPDFLQVGARHYHLRVGDRLIDPTVYQFFKVPAGFQCPVMLGDRASFIAALRELHAKYGYSSLVDPKIASVEQFFDEYWGKATLFKSGNDLYQHGGKATGRIRGYYR